MFAFIYTLKLYLFVISQDLTDAKQLLIQIVVWCRIDKTL